MIIENAARNKLFEQLRSTLGHIKEKCLQYEFLKDMPFFPDIPLMEQLINKIQYYNSVQPESSRALVLELIHLISKANDALAVITNKDNQQKEDEELNEIKNLERELEEINSGIEGLNTSISADRRELHQLELQCKELEEEIGIRQRNKKDARRITPLKLNMHSKGCFQYLQRNQILAHFKIVLTDDSKTAFQFVNPPNTPEDIPILTLMTGRFTYRVKVSIESLDIKAAIQEFRQHHDPAVFIQLVYQKWIKHIPVLHEILQLRKRYAVDWIAKQSLLKVMFRQSRQIICSLIIPEDYPNDQAVTLQAIHGLPVEDDIRKYQLPGNHTLTEWLDHLANAFSQIM